MFTLLGKFLVMFNVAFSIIGFTWAVVLYTNGVNYTDDPPAVHKDKPEAPKTPAGLLYEPSQQIKETASTKYPAERSWSVARKAMLDKEGRTIADRPWYQERLKHQRVEASEASPAQTVVFSDKLMPEEDKEKFDRPKLADAELDGKKYQKLTFYEDKLAENMRELVNTRDEFESKLKKDVELTNKILGMPPDEKGLRQMTVDERIKRLDVEEEFRMLQPYQTVVEYDAELLIKRQDVLDERLKELNDYLRTKHGVTFAD